MRTKLILAGIALMLATAVQAQFVGTVELKNGQRLQGLLWPEHGKLFILNGQDTMRFGREEIGQVWRSSPAPGNGKLTGRIDIFVSWMPIIPDRLLGGMVGFNVGAKEKFYANMGFFYHRGVGANNEIDNIQSGSHINTIERRNEYDSRSIGLVYAVKIQGREVFFMGGEIENKFTAYIEQDGKQMRNPRADKIEKSFLFSIMEASGKIFFNIGATNKPLGIIAGIGVKI